MKYFIITVDTEGDNLWQYKPGETITTNNTQYIPRFQALCEKYGFKPVYLTNYEMLCDDEYIAFAKSVIDRNTAEIGLHPHAWNNPPLYDLDIKYSDNAYLIEYPDDIMRAKFKTLYDLYIEKLGVKPISHRAGRWAMNDKYFKLLEEFDIKVDCSVTPHINWSKCMGAQTGGSNYEDSPSHVHYVGQVLEIPFTIMRSRIPLSGSIRERIKTIMKGKSIHFRPAVSSVTEMKYIVYKCIKSKDTDVIEFMLHSSELMPGGSPYFKDKRAIEVMYCSLEALFRYIKKNNLWGITMQEYQLIYSQQY